jgi:hypothetical protein
LTINIESLIILEYFKSFYCNGKEVNRMKKIIALFTALAFAMTLGVAFAQEKAPAPAPEKKMEEPAPAKKKSHKEKKADKKKKKAEKKSEKKEAAAPAEPAAK